MSEQVFFNRLLISWFVVAVSIFISLFFVVAPYGRHIRRGWGPAVGNKLGWVVMEAVSPVVFAACFLFRNQTSSFTAIIFLLLWEAHYIHRAFIYPFSLRGKNRQMPLIIVSFAFVFNAMNSYLNSRYLFTFSGGYSNEWLIDPRFVIGVTVFIAGFVINRQADNTLRNLRKPGESEYRVSDCGLYRWISCPNYLGEILTWVGWAVATWSLPGLAFAIWTVANLAPRARAHHAWYKQYFPDYPTERKALVPKIW